MIYNKNCIRRILGYIDASWCNVFAVRIVRVLKAGQTKQRKTFCRILATSSSPVRCLRVPEKTSTRKTWLRVTQVNTRRRAIVVAEAVSG